MKLRLRVIKQVPLFIVFFLVLWPISQSYGALTIPTGLSSGNQDTLLGVLGFGTSFKLVNNPYPLGGYSGVELGFTMESMGVSEVGFLGARGSDEKTLNHPKISIGKGIFENFDLFFSFLPMNERVGMGSYGGGMRWGFYQAKFFPACLSLLAHGTSLNYNNQIFTQTMGFTLTAAVQSSIFSFYLGGGTLYGEAQFDPNITITKERTKRSGRSFQTLIGLNIGIKEYFAAFEIDNYINSVFSFKAGTRF